MSSLLFAICLKFFLWSISVVYLRLLSSFGWLLLTSGIIVLLTWLERYNYRTCTTFLLEVFSISNHNVLWVVVWWAIWVVQVVIVLHWWWIYFCWRIGISYWILLFLGYLLVNWQIFLFLLFHKTLLCPLNIIKMTSLHF